MSRPQSTGLVVPVDAARRARRAVAAPAARRRPLPAAARDGALAVPAGRRRWTRPRSAACEELLSGAQPFAFALTRVATLADATVLVPEPAEPFAALTRLLWDEWPECPPFGGAFDDIAPHVVVAIDPSAADRAAIEAALAPLLPLEARAAEVLLVEETASGALRERRRFALGGPAAVTAATAAPGRL